MTWQRTERKHKKKKKHHKNQPSAEQSGDAAPRTMRPKPKHVFIVLGQPEGKLGSKSKQLIRSVPLVWGALTIRDNSGHPNPHRTENSNEHGNKQNGSGCCCLVVGFFFGSATQQIQLLNLLLQSSSIKCAAVPLQSRVWMVISPGRRKKTSSSISSRIFHFLFPQISAILFLHLKPKAAEKKKKKKKAAKERSTSLQQYI